MPLPLLPVLLGALKYAPSVLGFAKEAISAATGEEPPSDAMASPESIAEYVGGLAPEQRERVTARVLEFKESVQAQDTARFLSMNEGDAEKIRATARPKIALRAMDVLSTFAWMFKAVIVVTIIDWVVRVLLIAAKLDFELPSVWGLMAEAEPVVNLIWPPLIASVAASVAVIKKYMGCRERDKAQQFELTAGRPLSASQATIQEAGGVVGTLVKAFRGGGGRA